MLSVTWSLDWYTERNGQCKDGQRHRLRASFSSRQFGTHHFVKQIRGWIHKMLPFSGSWLVTVLTRSRSTHDSLSLLIVSFSYENIYSYIFVPLKRHPSLAYCHVNCPTTSNEPTTCMTAVLIDNLLATFDRCRCRIPRKCLLYTIQNWPRWSTGTWMNVRIYRLVSAVFCVVIFDWRQVEQ